MKTNLTIASIAAILFITSCTTSTYVSIMKPAIITLPSSIQTIALIDRTEPTSQTANIIEGVLTGELAGQDKMGAENTISGLADILAESPRLKAYRLPERMKTSLVFGDFPQQLNWDEVNYICDTRHVDAIVALEKFDSDFIVTQASEVKREKNKDGKEINYTEYKAEGVANLKIAFRLYDPKTKSIVDQYRFSRSNSWNATARSAREAANKLINRNNAIQEVGYNAGSYYGRRISPSWITVSREYYTKAKGNADMEAGKRFAQTNDWKGAAEHWRKATESKIAKVAGRACFNMALACEIEGNLDAAIQWATKAYVEYGNSNGRNYANILRDRQYEQQRLNEQLNK